MVKERRFIIGSRSSKLAMTQARCVQNILKRAYPDLEFEIVNIKTKGDSVSDVPLSRIGGKGLFTKEIEEALLRHDIDIAVHSMKDLPTLLPSGLIVRAITKREDPRDVLISGDRFTLKTLPAQSKVGTSSLRRRAQLLSLRKDLLVLDLRGNLDTRIAKLEQGLYDAIILAHAGIRRLSLEVNLSVISMGEMLPQAGQGALGIEVRGDDGKVNDMVAILDDDDCHIAVEAERALLSRLEGGCQVPIGVYAEVRGSRISIKAGVFSLDGNSAVRDEMSGNRKDAVILARQLAEKMIENKIANRILQDIRKMSG